MFPCLKENINSYDCLESLFANCQKTENHTISVSVILMCTRRRQMCKWGWFCLGKNIFARNLGKPEIPSWMKNPSNLIFHKQYFSPEVSSKVMGSGKEKHQSYLAVKAQRCRLLKYLEVTIGGDICCIFQSHPRLHRLSGRAALTVQRPSSECLLDQGYFVCFEERYCQLPW